MLCSTDFCAGRRRPARERHAWSEITEFRIDEDFASRLFADDEGEKLGPLIRKIKLTSDDPRFNKIGDQQRRIRAASGKSFFYGWNTRRQYSNEELAAACCFHLMISATFEPAGEECGTRYDDSAACSSCGAGAVQLTDLRLDLRKTPKGKDIARTIANEWIVSQRLAELMIDADLTGFELRPVQHKAQYEDELLELRLLSAGQTLLEKAEAAGISPATGKFYVWLNKSENSALLEEARSENSGLKSKGDRSALRLPVWYQLIVPTASAEIVFPTRVGNDPFDYQADGTCLCPQGDLIGLSLLSEVSISAPSRGNADIICSRQFIGVRRGLLRPSRIIFISSRFWRLIERENIKGFGVEIAHLV